MSDKSYAEATGHAPFDWNKWLDAAIENPPCHGEIYRAAIRSREWTTCAVGNACAIIPRYNDGCPDDSVLAALGREFHREILACEQSFDHELPARFAKAKGILQDIEARSAILIQEELAKLNQK